jgi:opacity protein-like surface antigen
MWGYFMRKFLVAAIAAAGLMSAASAHAADTLHFDITNIDVSVANGPSFCLGCAVTATPTSAPVTFDLGAGEANTFKFVDFDLQGLGFGSATIDATLTFDSPITGSVGSTGSANYVEFLGFLTAGSLTWSPVLPNNPITTANGSTFDVSFQDLSGLKGGSHVADYVTITAENVVPEPASWALMISGFGMAGSMLRRRRTAAALA